LLARLADKYKYLILQKSFPDTNFLDEKGNRSHNDNGKKYDFRNIVIEHGGELIIVI
jgi:hypothetical protein